jgi:hypothetical protein
MRFKTAAWSLHEAKRNAGSQALRPIPDIASLIRATACSLKTKKAGPDFSDPASVLADEGFESCKQHYQSHRIHIYDKPDHGLSPSSGSRTRAVKLGGVITSV